VLMGYFESVDTGSAVERIALGFGSGAAHLQTAVEGYLMTERGLRRLGAGEVYAGGGKAPGGGDPPCSRRRKRQPHRPDCQWGGESRWRGEGPKYD
jgi:hypothetical protein